MRFHCDFGATAEGRILRSVAPVLPEESIYQYYRNGMDSLQSMLPHTGGQRLPFERKLVCPPPDVIRFHLPSASMALVSDEGRWSPTTSGAHMFSTSVLKNTVLYPPSLLVMQFYSEGGELTGVGMSSVSRCLKSWTIFMYTMFYLTFL